MGWFEDNIPEMAQAAGGGPTGAAAAPPPISPGGMSPPDPGFNSTAPPITPKPFVPTGRFVSQSGPTAGRTLVSPFMTPLEQQQFHAQGTGMEEMAKVPARAAEFQAQYGALTKNQIDVMNAKYEQMNKMLHDMEQGDSDTHYKIKLGPSGPEVSDDPGKVLPRTVLGEHLPKGTRIRGVDGDEEAIPGQNYILTRYERGKNRFEATETDPNRRYGINIYGQVVSWAADDPQGPQKVGAISPLSVPKTTVINKPGELPTTQVSQGQFARPPAAGVPPAGVAPALPAPNPATGGTPPTTNTAAPPAAAPKVTVPSAAGAPRPTVGGNQIVANNYDAMTKGIKLPPGQEQAVREWARVNGKPLPEAYLPPSAQRDVRDVDTVLSEVSSLKQELQKRGEAAVKSGNPQWWTKTDYYPEYFRYAHLGGQGTDPNSDPGGFWSQLSFERYRSGGAALKGMSSRAQSIINGAMEHTPRPDYGVTPSEIASGHGHTPDTPAQMLNKLNGIESILRSQREKTFQDESQGGQLMKKEFTPPGATPPAPTVVHWGRDAQGNPIKLGP